jgi:hypothetical protein
MLKKYTPAGVVVNDAMDIVQYRGKTGPYLEQTSGKPSHNLIVWQRRDWLLNCEIFCIKQSRKTEVKKENIPVKINDEPAYYFHRSHSASKYHRALFFSAVSRYIFKGNRPEFLKRIRRNRQIIR